jgi:peptide/nickel transport system substrate-binding protein
VFLALLVLSATPAAARGGSEKAPSTGGKAGAAAAAVTYREAPMLAERVRAGKLPALDKRLPTAPLVVKPAGEGARYGGTWRQALTSSSVESLWTSAIRTRVLGLSDSRAAVVPELVESVKASPDNRVFTLTLRKGLKWSDGDACDADDFVFAWQDVLLDPELWPAKPSEIVVGDKLPRLDKVDQFTVRYTFPDPNVLFLRRLAQPRVSVPLVLPQHYLKKVHVKYAQKEKLQELVTQGGYASWAELFAEKSRPWRNPELPVLDPWVALDDGAAGVLHLERNPYYWQVDAEGNQLPYIDAFEVTLASDAMECVRLAASGAVDLQIALLAGLAARAELEAGEAAGACRLVELEPMNANIHTIFLNRTAADAAKARLFGDFRFREALSLAIDREAINQAAHGGRARPSQVSLPRDSPSYDEEPALAYTAVDLDRANDILDELGLSWDEKRLWRLGADKKPLTFTVSYPTSWPPGQVPAVALLRAGWRQLGIDLRGEPLDREQWTARVRGGAWELAAYAVNAGGGAYLPESSNGVFPIDGHWYPAPQWGLWLATDGAQGAEPPAEVKKLRELYEEYASTATGERALQIEKEAFGIYARELLALGVLTRPSGELLAVRSGRMRGLPEGPILDDLSLHHPAAFYFTTD